MHDFVEKKGENMGFISKKMPWGRGLLFLHFCKSGWNTGGMGGTGGTSGTGGTVGTGRTGL